MTVVEPVARRPSAPAPAYARAVYFFGALGELMFGYDVGVIGVALLFIKREMGLTPLAQGLVVSSLLGGAAVGVGCAGVLADRYGRRPLLIAMAAVFALGGLAGALAPTAFWLIIARTVMGVGVGASAVVVMVYLAELAPGQGLTRCFEHLRRVFDGLAGVTGGQHVSQQVAQAAAQFQYVMTAQTR